MFNIILAGRLVLYVLSVFSELTVWQICLSTSMSRSWCKHIEIPEKKYGNNKPLIELKKVFDLKVIAEFDGITRVF